MQNKKESKCLVKPNLALKNDFSLPKEFKLDRDVLFEWRLTTTILITGVPRYSMRGKSPAYIEWWKLPPLPKKWSNHCSTVCQKNSRGLCPNSMNTESTNDKGALIWRISAIILPKLAKVPQLVNSVLNSKRGIPSPRITRATCSFILMNKRMLFGIWSVFLIPDHVSLTQQ